MQDGLTAGFPFNRQGAVYYAAQPERSRQPNAFEQPCASNSSPLVDLSFDGLMHDMRDAPKRFNGFQNGHHGLPHGQKHGQKMSQFAETGSRFKGCRQPQAKMNGHGGKHFKVVSSDVPNFTCDVAEGRFF